MGRFLLIEGKEIDKKVPIYGAFWQGRKMRFPLVTKCRIMYNLIEWFNSLRVLCAEKNSISFYSEKTNRKTEKGRETQI